MPYANSGEGPYATTLSVSMKQAKLENADVAGIMLIVVTKLGQIAFVVDDENLTDLLEVAPEILRTLADRLEKNLQRENSTAN